MGVICEPRTEKIFQKVLKNLLTNSTKCAIISMSKGQGNRNLGHNLAQKPIALMEEQIVGCESGTETCVRQGGRDAKPPLRHQKISTRY